LSQPNVLFNIAQYQYLTSQYPNFGQYSRPAREPPPAPRM
jgi:hypothetical protein